VTDVTDHLNDMTNPFAPLELAAAELRWRLPELPAELDAATRDVLGRMLATFDSGRVPRAPGLMPFETSSAIRPRSHRRAFYVRLPAPAKGFVAIKGTEVLHLEALEALVAGGVHRAINHEHGIRAVEVFPIREHKVPMALVLREALDEAEIGAALVSAYLRRYRALPDLSIPLAAFAWPRANAEAFAQTLVPHLSPWAREICQRLISSEGLGVYAYYAAVAPFPRARDVGQELDARSLEKARLRLLKAAHGEPTAIVERWIRTVARMLNLGFMPCTPDQSAIGQAIQAQNAIVGGGFVDLDSVRPMAEIVEDEEFALALMVTLETLARTLGVLLFDDFKETQTRFPFGYALIGAQQILQRMIDEDAAMHGDCPDARLRRFFSRGRGSQALLDVANTLQNAPTPADLEALLASR